MTLANIFSSFYASSKKCISRAVMTGWNYAVFVRSSSPFFLFA